MVSGSGANRSIQSMFLSHLNVFLSPFLSPKAMKKCPQVRIKKKYQISSWINLHWALGNTDLKCVYNLSLWLCFKVRMTLRNDTIVISTNLSLCWLKPLSGIQLFELECSNSAPFILSNYLHITVHHFTCTLTLSRSEMICFAKNDMFCHLAW